MEKVDGRKLIGDYIFVSKYAQTIENQKETWEEAVSRVMNMHREHLRRIGKYNEMTEELISKAEKLYREKRILGAQRALQFGGEVMF